MFRPGRRFCWEQDLTFLNLSPLTRMCQRGKILRIQGLGAERQTVLTVAVACYDQATSEALPETERGSGQFWGAMTRSSVQWIDGPDDLALPNLDRGLPGAVNRPFDSDDPRFPVSDLVLQRLASTGLDGAADEQTSAV